MGSAVVLAAQAVIDADARPFVVPAVLFVIVSSMFDVLSAVFPAEHRAREYVGYQLGASVGTLAMRLLMVSALGITLMFWSVVVIYLLLLPVMWARAGLLAPHRLLAVAASEATPPSRPQFRRLRHPDDAVARRDAAAGRGRPIRHRVLRRAPPTSGSTTRTTASSWAPWH